MFTQAVLLAATQYIFDHQSIAAQQKNVPHMVTVQTIAALTHNVNDFALAIAIAEVESGFYPHAKNKTSGAFGLMQVMPMYFKKNERNSFNAMVLGVEVLRDALKRRPTLSKALAYYNGGTRGEKSTAAKNYAVKVGLKYFQILAVLETAE